MELQRRALYLGTHPPDAVVAHTQDGAWRLEHVISGQRALEELGARHRDYAAMVVRPSGLSIDTSGLLAQARTLSPGVACVVTSTEGPAKPRWERDYIATPRCTAAELAELLDRACRLQTALCSPAVAKIAGAVERLPALPRTYWQLSEIVESPNCDLSQVVRIIESDPAVSAMILQFANSAFFGMVRRLSTVRQAVSVIGLNVLTSLVLGTHVFREMGRLKPQGFSLERFQEYSLRVARHARSFIKDRELGDTAFTVAILHDIGKLVLAVAQPAIYGEICAKVAQGDVDTSVLERELLGVTHAEAGAFLLASWRLPLDVVECVAFHHQLDQVRGGDLQLVAVLHAADTLTGIVSCGEPESSLNRDFIARAGLGHELERWRALVESETAERLT